MARAAFVYETENEFLSSGDFNGDGNVDALVLDKATGNARIGYQGFDGGLSWSPPFTNGVVGVAGVGIGKFIATNRDAIAVTAPNFNRIALMNVPTAGSNSPPAIILPGPPTPTNGLIAAWDFSGLPATTASTATPATIPSTVGAGTLDVSAFGLGVPQGTNPERTSFSGTTSNTFPGSVDGNPGTALALANSSANGKSALISFSMTGYRDLILSFDTRGTSTGFTNGVWAWSTDGVNFTTLPGVNTATTNPVFSTAIVNFTTATNLNNSATVFLRYTLSGATGTGGNNRLDNVQLNATPTAAGGLGPHGLAGMTAPFGTNAPFDRLLCVSSQNPSPSERLHLLDMNTGSVTAAREFTETMPLDRVNALPIASNVTFAVGMARGSNDALHVWRFTNSPASAFTSSNLPSGSEYTFGNFYLEPWPRFVTYVPGESNLTVFALEDVDTNPRFGAAQVSSFDKPIHAVFHTDIGTNAQLWIQFDDGILGARPPLGSGPVQSNFWLSAASSGNAPAGVVGIGVNKAAFLFSVSNSGATDFAKIFAFNGTTWNETASNALPSITTSSTRANVWLFTSEPFVNANAGFVAAVSAPDWSQGMSGLPANLSVNVQSDGGATNGLTGSATNNLGTPPTGSSFGTPNQYHPAISLFGYSSATPPEPIIVTISPSPGVYGAPVKVTFTKQNAAHSVRYRLSSGAAWLTYSAPFTLTNDATVQFYGEYSTNNLRGRLQYATYVLGRSNLPPAPTLTLPGFETNPPPTLNTNLLQISSSGTVFYGRRGAGNINGTLWAINLDGSGETFITTGLRPRVSRDGHYISFLRESDPATNQYSLWARDLATGVEVRLHSSSNQYVGHDWTADNSGIIIDNNCFFWRIGLTGAATQLPLPTDCSHGAPSVNPLDGQLAFQTITPATYYLYLAPSNAASRQDLLVNIDNPRWPAWSPDGQRIAIANNVSLGLGISAGHDLFVVSFGTQTNVHQITALNPISNFPNGAVWTPNGNKLVGAGRINGTNGLWVIPLAADGSACHCPPQLLPTSPGDDIDFAGGVVATSVSVSYANLGLFIRLEPNAVVVYWSTNYDGFALESALDIPAGFSWTPVDGPYFRAGPYFEYRESRTALAARKYFRLAYPGVLVLTPSEPQLDFHFEPNAAVLNWPLNYVGYTLEAATNLSPPVLWTPLNVPYLNTNGLFEYRRTLPGPPQEFYRLRWP